MCKGMHLFPKHLASPPLQYCKMSSPLYTVIYDKLEWHIGLINDYENQ